MSGIRFLADTNALIYLLGGNSCMIAATAIERNIPLLTADLAFSKITELQVELIMP